MTLVDAGVGFIAKGILRFVEGLGKGSLKRILLTHGHSDHVGAVSYLKSRLDVPVLAHPVEMPYMEGSRPYLRRRRAAVTVPHGVATPLELDEAGEPKKVGSLRPYLTPGHSPGHVVYVHEKDGVMLAGDLFTSRKGKLRRPIPAFTGDMAEAIRSSAIVGVVKPGRLEVCHGDSSVINPALQLESYWNETLHLVESRQPTKNDSLASAQYG